MNRTKWNTTGQHGTGPADALFGRGGVRRRTRLSRFDVVTRLVERLRLVKSPAEIQHIRDAARFADIAMSAAIGAAAPEATELDVATVEVAAERSRPKIIQQTRAAAHTNHALTETIRKWESRRLLPSTR
jgi:Xaa-Pro aminopeptidase